MTYQVKIQAVEEFGVVEIKTTTPEVFVQVAVPPPAGRSKVVIIAKGDKGDTGEQGPNSVSEETSSTLGNGIVLSVDGFLSLAVPDVDFLTPGKAEELYQPVGNYLTSETDPIFSAWFATNPFSGYATETWVNQQGFIKGYTETDPVWNSEKSGYLTTGSAASTYQPKGDYITSIGTSTPTSITGLLKGSSGSVAAAVSGTDYVAPGGAGTVTTIADVTITAADLPTYAVTADAGTDVVTFPVGTTVANGVPYYIEGGTPPTFGDAVNRAFVNEWVGPVVYAVNSSGNTCKLSATSGGAALDITNAGIGWTLRKAAIQSLNINFDQTQDDVEVIAFLNNGFGWSTTGQSSSSLAIRINGNSSEYMYGSTEYTFWAIGAMANLFSEARIRIYPSEKGNFFGTAEGSGKYGTDQYLSNSTQVSSNPGHIKHYEQSLSISSVSLFSSSGNYMMKVGTRIKIRKY